MTVLRANLLQCFCIAIGVCVLIAGALHFLADTPFDASLVLPLLVMACLSCALSVPAVLEFSPQHLHIRFWFRRDRVLSWSDLRFAGYGRTVLLLQFRGIPTIQIFPFAYRGADFRGLTEFLKREYPQRKADFWFGAMGFRWPWRRSDPEAPMSLLARGANWAALAGVAGIILFHGWSAYSEYRA
jgi:hypothetical protein